MCVCVCVCVFGGGGGQGSEGIETSTNYINTARIARSVCGAQRKERTECVYMHTRAPLGAGVLALVAVAEEDKEGAVEAVIAVLNG